MSCCCQNTDPVLHARWLRSYSLWSLRQCIRLATPNPPDGGIVQTFQFRSSLFCAIADYPDDETHRLQTEIRELWEQLTDRNGAEKSDEEFRARLLAKVTELQSQMDSYDPDNPESSY